uniref:ZP domain-containing protein n=1 Tax=Strongyloides papillosus TaxID=174720 RepID=A0A0N5BJ98_STREA
MDSENLGNLKIFNNVEEVGKSVFDVYIREINAEVDSLDKKRRKMSNVKICSDGGKMMVLKLRDHVNFSSFERKFCSSAISLGFNAGKMCQLSFEFNKKLHGELKHGKKICTYRVNSYLTFARPIGKDGVISYIDVSIEVPQENNDDVNLFQCYIKNI